MYIESIELKDYRNYTDLHMDFSRGTNILCGDNAQNKIPPGEQRPGADPVRPGGIPH